MKNDYLIDDVFHVDGKPFEFIVTRDREIILLNLIGKRDSFGYPEPLDMYRAVNPILGARVYRIVIKKALDAVFGRGFKTFHFSIGMEECRYPLYKRLADRIARLGFDCYDCGGHFYFYKHAKLIG